MGDQGLVRKLRAISDSLIAWSKRKFSNAQWQINHLKMELQNITNDTPIHYDGERVKQISDKIQSMCRQKEMY